MTLPRFSTRSIGFLVLLVAVDIVWFPRALGRHAVPELNYDCLELPFLVMVNVLAVAGYSSLSRPVARPFLASFVAGGLFGSAVSFAYLHIFPTFAPSVLALLFPLQVWILRNRNSGNSGYDIRYFTFLAALTLAGTLALIALALLLAALIRLVARRKVPWFVAVALVVALMASASLRLRWFWYRDMALRQAETCEVLARESDALRAEIEKAKSKGSPTDSWGNDIRVAESEKAHRDAALAKHRQWLEMYRRGMRRPWLNVEE